MSAINFSDFNLSPRLLSALDDMGITAPTDIQQESLSVIKSGKNMIGIAQTGTGKTIAYLLPLINDLSFSDQKNPRILIMVPTRELVDQVVGEVEKLCQSISVRVCGVYGGVNIATQREKLKAGFDIIVATPGRLYDLVLSRDIILTSLKKLVIDEVDVMLDLGFRFQLNNLFELMPDRRQNLMFSATMTDEVEDLIHDFFVNAQKIAIAPSGTPLDTIEQSAYQVENFYTKINLLAHLLLDVEEFSKVLVFAPSKAYADKILNKLEDEFPGQLCVIHANKSQNYRSRSIEQFNDGEKRVLIATDVIARGLDLDNISHVINIDTPRFPENYMHRIGRTGRAEAKGKSILFYTKKEKDFKLSIEELMGLKIPEISFPSEVPISNELTKEENPKPIELHNRNSKLEEKNDGFHEKKEKNMKTNQGGSYRAKIAKKYKKPKTRGDKRSNNKKRR